MKPFYHQLLLFVTIFFSSTTFSQEISLTRGMVLKKSARIRKALYQLDGWDTTGRAVITIRGNNLVIDFRNAVLTGSHLKKDPDGFFGVAIAVTGGKNITIKNLTAKGYKIALLATGVQNLKLENCNFSYNYRQRLKSTPAKEDLSDWLSYHQNEKDEWMRYGAAIYLRNCDSALVRNCKVTGGQNALLMRSCRKALVYNNDFSFNSGVGIGLYRSSDNQFLYNRVIFNVRGYSDGVYSRGQDSAGMLVFEQSDRNLFYKNAVTHGGDGFFLWAGQSTMDSGAGGCNDNILLENDFSYAPTNGIEVTFSRNQILHNRIFSCDHGIWAGYSYDTRISTNQFRNNRIAIAIEHGQHNQIDYNLFYGDSTAIRLWANEKQDPDWGYPKHHDTRSVGYLIAGNSYNRNRKVYDLSRTYSIRLSGNQSHYATTELKMDSLVSALDSSFDTELMYTLSEETQVEVPEIASPMDPFKGSGKLAGRQNIRMTEWGPYDFQYPLIWNQDPAGNTDTLRFDILGPVGKWKILTYKGLDSISKLTDSFPATITTIQKTGAVEIELIAEFKGAAFIDAFGKRVPQGQPYRFRYHKTFGKNP